MADDANPDVAFTAAIENTQALRSLKQMMEQIEEVGESGTTMSSLLRDDVLETLKVMASGLVKFGDEYEAQAGRISKKQLVNQQEQIKNMRALMKVIQKEIDVNRPKMKVDVVPPDTSTIVDFDGETRGIGGARTRDQGEGAYISREDIQNLRDRTELERNLNAVHAQTIAALKEIDEVGEGAYAETTEEIKLQRLALQSLYEQYEKGEEGAKTTRQLDSEIRRTSRSIKDQLNGIRELHAEQSRKPAAIGELEIAYEKVNEEVKRLRDVGTETANAQADAYQKWANDVKKVADREGQTSDQLKKSQIELKKIANGAKAAATDLRNMQKTINQFSSIDEKLQARRTEDTMKRVTAGINQALNSTDSEIREIAESLDDVRRRSRIAFRLGESSAEQYEGALNGVEDRLNRIGIRTKETGEKMSSGWGGSAWRMGNAMDRMGARSVGSLVRVHEAFKDLSPAMIGAGLAVAGITVAFTKLAQAAVDALKKVVDGLVAISKESLEVAKEIELLDFQFQSLFSNIGSESERLGKVMRKHLFGESARLGFDLTGDFAEVVVPLSGDIEQVDRLAEQAAILAHVRGKTSEQISNAIKQAAGGHFRPLIQQFGFTPANIAAMQEFQKEFGQMEGTLRGMEEFTRSRGLSFDAISDSLQVMIGKAQIARKELELLIGEPIKDEVEDQLGNMFESLEDNREAIEGLASGFGTAIASIIEVLGDHINEIIGSITDQDVETVKGAFTDIADGINTAISAVAGLADGDFTTIADGFAEIAEAIKEATVGLADFIKFTQDFKEAYEKIDSIGGRISGEGSGLLSLGREMGNAADEINHLIDAGGELLHMLEVLFSGGTYSVDEWRRDLLGPLVESIPLVGDVIRTLGLEDDIRGTAIDTTGKHADAVTEFTEAELEAANALTDSWQIKNQTAMMDQELINKSLALGDAERKYAAAVLEAAEADKEIADARLDFYKEYTERRLELAAEQAKKELDIEIDKSNKLEDLEQKRMDQLDDLAAERDRNRADITLDSYRKEEDINRKYDRKLEDIERDRSRKRIDIEQKLQEQLRDIRKKYLDQLEEAARRNDAVSFLRTQRNMKRDIEGAKENAQKEREEADKVNEQKRDDAKIWLDRQVKDAEIAEGRKLTDLFRAQSRKEQEIEKNYRREKDVIDKWEERKLDELKRWREEANDDLAKWHDDELLKLDATLEDQYALVEARSDAFLHYMQLQLQEAMGINAQFAQQAAEAVANAAMIGMMMSTGPLGMSGAAGLAGSIGFNTGVGGPIQRQRTLLPTWGDDQGELRQHGGYTRPNADYMVGETRPEAFRTTRAGIIDPNPFMFSPSSLGGGTMIDNSSRVSANIGLSDPTQMDPLMVTQVQMMITERILQARYS